MSEFATILELQKIKAEIKKLLTPLNKLKVDPEDIQKYIKQEIVRKSSEQQKKAKENYKFTEHDRYNFLERCIDGSVVQDILEIDIEDDDVYGYDYSNFLAEHHKDKLDEIMKILIETHNRIGSILLPLVVKDDKKKRPGSFATRRDKFA